MNNKYRACILTRHPVARNPKGFLLCACSRSFLVRHWLMLITLNPLNFSPLRHPPCGTSHKLLVFKIEKISIKINKNFIPCPTKSFKLHYCSKWAALSNVVKSLTQPTRENSKFNLDVTHWHRADPSQPLVRSKSWSTTNGSLWWSHLSGRFV